MDQKVIKTIYVTKYLGVIRKCEAEITESGAAYVDFGYPVFFRPWEFYYDEESAQKAAQALISKRSVAIEKSLAKLQAMLGKDVPVKPM